MTIEEIIEKWNEKIESLEASGMSETDDPYFAIEIIKEIIQDLEKNKEIENEN